MLYQVLHCNRDLKRFADLTLVNGTIKMKYDVIKSALEIKVGHLKTYYKGYFGKLLLEIRPNKGIFNMYGRIVLKKEGLCTLL